MYFILYFRKATKVAESLNYDNGIESWTTLKPYMYNICYIDASNVIMCIQCQIKYNVENCLKLLVIICYNVLLISNNNMLQHVLKSRVFKITFNTNENLGICQNWQILSEYRSSFQNI